jgi:hypothetical protein
MLELCPYLTPMQFSRVRALFGQPLLETQQALMDADVYDLDYETAGDYMEFGARQVIELVREVVDRVDADALAAEHDPTLRARNAVGSQEMPRLSELNAALRVTHRIHCELGMSGLQLGGVVCAAFLLHPVVSGWVADLVESLASADAATG